MSIFSQTKNKTAFFLHIILLLNCGEKAYGNPIYDVYQSINGMTKDNPALAALISTVVGTVLSHQIRIYLEDPELKNLTIQEKKKDLELKNHPDYIEITLLEKKINAQHKGNKIEGRRQELVLQELQRRIHVEEKIEKFEECARSSITQKEREKCQMMHDNLVERYNSYFPAK